MTKTIASLFVFATLLSAQTRLATISWSPGPGNPATTRYNVFRAMATCFTAISAGTVFVRQNPDPVNGTTFTQPVPVGQVACYYVQAIDPSNAALDSEPSVRYDAAARLSSPTDVKVLIEITIATPVVKPQE